MNEKYHKRNLAIERMYLEGVNMRGISLKMGVSYQRIQQILAKLGTPIRNGKLCSKCGKNKVEHYNKTNRFHLDLCANCYQELRKAAPTWSQKYYKCKRCTTIETPHASNGLCKNCYQHLLYKENPKYREKKTRQVLRWRSENTEKFNKYHREYYQNRFKNDPEYREKIKTNSRKYYHAIKSDPVRCKEYLKREHIKYQHRQQRIKNDPVLLAEFRQKQQEQYLNRKQKKLKRVDIK